MANDQLDIEAFKAWRPEYADAEFVLEDGKYICGWAIEKMSKSMFNVVNPDYIVERYGADTLRLYEMFLGPISQSKPWDSNGIDGCSRFLRKVWSLFYSREGNLILSDSEPSRDSLKSINKLIRKVSQDIENYSYNTSISAFMICVSELAQQKCSSRVVLEQFVELLAPFAPHICEELWEVLGHHTTVYDSPWPEAKEEFLKQDSETISISFNGKTRFTMDFAPEATSKDIEAAVMASDNTAKYIDGKKIVKVIVVPHRIVNIVVK